jgi:hypothetical protein
MVLTSDINIIATSSVLCCAVLGEAWGSLAKLGDTRFQSRLPVKTQLQWIWNDDINCFTSLNKFLVTRYVNSMPNTLFKVFKINESIKTFMKEKK